MAALARSWGRNRAEDSAASASPPRPRNSPCHARPGLSSSAPMRVPASNFFIARSTQGALSRSVWRVPRSSLWAGNPARLGDAPVRDGGAPVWFFGAPAPFGTAPISFGAAPAPFSGGPVSLGGAPVRFSSVPVPFGGAPIWFSPAPISFGRRPKRLGTSVLPAKHVLLRKTAVRHSSRTPANGPAAAFRCH
jgi:hypothetical protein